MSPDDIKGNFPALKGAIRTEEDEVALEAALNLVECVVLDLHRIAEVMRLDGMERERVRQPQREFEAQLRA